MTMRTGKRLYSTVKSWFFKAGAAVGLLAATLLIWWGAAAMIDFPLVGRPVGQVHAEAQTVTLSIHTGLPVLSFVTKDPWDLTVSDLTADRIWYNLLTKPGFRWLAIEILAGMLMVVIAWHLSWRLVHWSQATRQVYVSTRPVKQVHPSLLKPGLVVEIAGTVKIGTTAGIIYQAWESLTQSGERELALVLGKLPVIRVIRVE